MDMLNAVKSMLADISSISPLSEQIINQSVNQSVSQSVNQSISQSISQSVSQSINQSVSQSINQSISQSINQSVNQSVNQSINQSISQSIRQSINQSVSHSINQKLLLIQVYFLQNYNCFRGPILRIESAGPSSGNLTITSEQRKLVWSLGEQLFPEGRGTQMILCWRGGEGKV